MSTFGNDSFKQQILDEIEFRIDEHKIKKSEAVAEVAEVLAWLSRSAFNRDEEIKRVRAEAKEEAKRELQQKLREA